MGRPPLARSRRSAGAQVIGRALDLLEVLARSPGELSVTELARRLGLHKSTVHRILTALTKRDYASANSATRRYSLGPHCLALATLWQARVDIREKARPHLEDLREKCHETVSLNLLVGDRRVPVESLEASHLLRYIVALGESFPLWLGASGKAILAFLAAERIGRLCRGVDGLDLRALMLDLRRIRARGYAIGGRLPSTQAVAAPIFRRPRTVIGSVAIVMPLARFAPEVKRSCVEQIVRTAQAISSELGVEAAEWNGEGPPPVAQRNR
jgi:IclR family KDG regulon transcriptional repressor